MNNFFQLTVRGIHLGISNKISQHRSLMKFCSSFSGQKKRIFDDVMSERRLEASRSIIVQVYSDKSFAELFDYCWQFGDIKGAHHYKIPQDDLHFILMEFEKVEYADNAIDSSCYNEDLQGVPVRSPFLWFRAGSKQKLKKSTASKLNVVDGTRRMSTQEVSDLLQSVENIDDQLRVLYEATCLNDLEIRLRFIAAKQIENSVKGMFPFANARPFGSSVNGFGKMGCDLDLILRLDEERKSNASSRLVFHTKENLTNGRSQIQRQMESIGDMLQLFLPGICNVRRILQARIPIIKFHHEHLHLDIDLSMSNLSGAYMSELLYLFGQIDERTRPLVFAIRRWAQIVGLTNPSPGRWITNFSLTCLVIFFLQQLKNPILPSINLLHKSAKPSDIRTTEDGINCTFLRDPNELKFSSEKNTSKLGELLLHFFEFYSQFDFQNRAISLNDGKSTIKPDHSPVYIINPFENILNVSKNISYEEGERFRIEVRNAAWLLESEIEKTELKIAGKIDDPWGLLSIFRTPEKSVIRPNMFFKPRMVEVSDLFDKSMDVNENSTKIEYKNQTVQSQVQNIKAKAKNDLKQMRLDSLNVSGSTKSSGRRR